MRILINEKLMITLSCVLMMMTACNHSGRYGNEAALFAGMDSLLEAAPDSAMAVLTRLQPKVDSIGDRSLSMRQRMHLASAQNKLYKPMPSDSAFQEVVDYYDRHGSANDRMQAHYLLGCIYRDRKEAPKAIRCYQQAIECADTVREDFNSRMMVIVYAQMAELYQKQHLYDQSLEMSRRQKHFCEQASDSIMNIRCDEYRIGTEYMQKKYQKVADGLLQIRQRYLSAGSPYLAARCLFTCIFANAKLEKWNKVDSLLGIYDAEDSLVNKDKEVVSGNVLYYYVKGRVLLNRHQPDSAFHFFRKLRKDASNWNQRQALYKGLSLYFEQTGRKDSALIYSRYHAAAVDSDYSESSSRELQHIQAMYDYESQQKQSLLAKEELRKQKHKSRLIGFVLLSLIISAVVVWHFYRLRVQKQLLLNEKKREKLERELLEMEKDLQKNIKSFSELKTDYEQLLLSYRSETERTAHERHKVLSQIEDYQKKMEELKWTISKQNSLIVTSQKEQSALDDYKRKNLNDEQLIITLKSKARSRRLPSAKEWEELQTLVTQLYPSFISQLQENVHSLSDTELYVCLLVRVKFSPSAIAVLTSREKSSISNIRRRIYEKAHHDCRKVTTKMADEWIWSMS